MKTIDKQYIEFDKNLRNKRSIIGCILSIILFPAGITLDYFVYPDFMWLFLKLRFSCSFLTILILGMHYTKIGKIYIKLLMFFWMMLAQILMCYMILKTEQYSSTYYAGLNLTILGTGVLLPLSFREVTLFCVLTLMSYVAVSYNHNIESFGILFNNIYFLVLSSVISVTAAHFNSKFRYREFCLNHELKNSISSLKSTQAQLIQSEKLNAMGSLSAGLLHEVNNPLNYTMTAVELIKIDPNITSDEDLKDTVKDIEEGMSRIKAIVTDLRAFAYPEEADKKVQFSVLSVVENALRFTSSESSGIKRINNIAEELKVTASKTHIVQVLINLISNASRAIAKSQVENGVITINALNKDGRVLISVKDNGPGIEKEVLSKIFDPFFTTNEVGKGMGLGLSVSHTIIKNHNGNLYATSDIGKGTTFYFDLETA